MNYLSQLPDHIHEIYYQYLSNAGEFNTSIRGKGKGYYVARLDDDEFPGTRDYWILYRSQD